MEYHLKSKPFMDEHFPFFIMRTTHEVNNLPTKHSHEFVELVYVVSGKAEHFFEGRFYPIHAGDVFIINPGEVHMYQIEQGDQLELINCLFVPNLIRTALLQELEISSSIDYFYVHPFLNPEKRFNHRLNLSGKSAEKVYGILEGMLEELEEKREGYATLIRLEMIRLLILLSRYYQQSDTNVHTKSKRDHERNLLVRRVNGYLERHYKHKITLENLAEFFHLSPRQLNRILKEKTGRTMNEMVHHIRIEKAKQLLMEDQAKVIYVAHAVGYDDPSFFSHLFKRYVGRSPGQYRNQSSQGNDERES